MKITVYMSNGEALTYYGKMKITDGAIEIKTENPQAAPVILPLAYVEGFCKEEQDAEKNNTSRKRANQS